jgi:uncharacterized membrane protein
MANNRGSIERGGSTCFTSKRASPLKCPLEEVYRFWRDLENLPRFMQHLETVKSMSDGRSHWIVKAPSGRTAEWDAEIVEDSPNERIVWRSVPDSDIRQEGSVRFREAAADRGTEIDVELNYDAPAGSPGAIIATLFGREPAQQFRNELRRLKQVLETGEVVLSEGSLEGAGEGPMQERPAQAPELETRP